MCPKGLRGSNIFRFRRRIEIPLLASHFLEKFNNLNKKAVTGITGKALRVLLDYSWPGNVRELQNLIERIVVLKETGEITVADLPAKMIVSSEIRRPAESYCGFPEKGMDLNKAVEDFEKDLLYKALKKTSGVKSRAAKLLGINRTTLVEKLKRLKITDL